jgi:hypothetical protein
MPAHERRDALDYAICAWGHKRDRATQDYETEGESWEVELTTREQNTLYVDLGKNHTYRKRM